MKYYLYILIFNLCTLKIWAQLNNDDVLKDSKINSDNCGLNKVNRIVGGVEAKAHSWPWTIALHEKSGTSSSDDDYYFMCGGSIINRRYIMSAAHCVKSGSTLTKASDLKVLLGAHNRKTTGTMYKVDKVIVNPNYNDRTMQYDISLLRLSVPIDFNATDHKMAPVCVADKTYAKQSLGKDEAVVVGWGTTLSQGELSDVLMQVNVPIVPMKECQKAYDKMSITSMNVCAGLKVGGKDSCQGDSGGPLKVRRGNKWVQVGITSWGRGCASPNAYGVYTKVASHYDWIVSTIATDAKEIQKPFQIANQTPVQRPDKNPNPKPNHKPNRRPNRKPNRRPNRKPNSRPNRKSNSRPNRKPNSRPNRKPNRPSGKLARAPT